MCIMMVMYQMVPEVPVLLASNRDEYYHRSAQSPVLLNQNPAVWGGRDEQAGGTWLGVNEYGLVVGLTNRRMSDNQETAADRRSRGLLCLDALQYGHVSDVAEFLMSEPPDRYNSFNLLVLNAEAALWIAYDGRPEIRPVHPGIHILANGDLNDTEHVRSGRARQLLQASRYADRNLSPKPSPADVTQALSMLQPVCQDHEAEVEDRQMLCMHRDDKNYGTVSSTLLAISTQLSKSVYRYASGPPCQTDYQDVSAIMNQGRTGWTVPA